MYTATLATCQNNEQIYIWETEKAEKIEYYFSKVTFCYNKYVKWITLSQ